MRIVNYFFLYTIAAGLFGCAGVSMSSGDQQSSSYKEDLSKYRLSYDSVEVAATAMKTLQEIPVKGKIEPQTDITEELDSLLAEIAEDNARKVVTGYTILVYSGASREEASNAKDQIYRILPDSRPQIQYVQPYYKVKVGKFIDRLEVQKDYTTIKEEFPSALIIPERFTVQ